MSLVKRQELQALGPVGALFENYINRLLTVKELAVILGASEKTIRHWVLKGEIPVVRPTPRMVRFIPQAVARWLAERSIYES